MKEYDLARKQVTEFRRKRKVLDDRAHKNAGIERERIKRLFEPRLKLVNEIVPAILVEINKELFDSKGKVLPWRHFHESHTHREPDTQDAHHEFSGLLAKLELSRIEKGAHITIFLEDRYTSGKPAGYIPVHLTSGHEPCIFNSEVDFMEGSNKQAIQSLRAAVIGLAIEIHKNSLGL